MIRNRMYLLTLFLCLLFILPLSQLHSQDILYSNSDSSSISESTDSARGLLLSSTFLIKIPLETLNSWANILGFNITAQYSVSIYIIVYQTVDNFGNVINASGIILIPDRDDPASFASVQHGTIFKNSDAPSFFGFSNISVWGQGIIPASQGYVTVMPDYLGFGESYQKMIHPYHHAKTLALSTIDMIRAGKGFCEDNNVRLNGKLFLVGYSEGGYATIATQREIEKYYNTELIITASSAGAGAYDLYETTKSMIDASEILYPAYLAFTLVSYDTTYQWNRNLLEIVKEPYASILYSLFDGTKDGDEINARLTTITRNLLQESFTQAFNEDGEQDIKAALHENSIHNWITHTPTLLFHGIRDDIVPYENSETAYNNFTNNGMENLESIKIVKNNICESHESCFYPFVEETLTWFAKYHCAATLHTIDSELHLYVPVIYYNSTNLWADFIILMDTDGALRIKVSDAGYVNPANYKDCNTSNLTSDLKLEIPMITFNTVSLWADFEYLPTVDGLIWFKLTGAGEVLSGS